jgi:hypothetical protein
MPVGEYGKIGEDIWREYSVYGNLLYQKFKD